MHQAWIYISCGCVFVSALILTMVLHMRIPPMEAEYELVDDHGRLYGIVHVDAPSDWMTLYWPNKFRARLKTKLNIFLLQTNAENEYKNVEALRCINGFKQLDQQIDCEFNDHNFTMFIPTEFTHGFWDHAYTDQRSGLELSWTGYLKEID